MTNPLRRFRDRWIGVSTQVSVQVSVAGAMVLAAVAIPTTADAQFRRATLAALVTDTAGTPLPGAAVWVGQRISALTDENGRVTIRQIPAGDYLVRARHDTHLAESVMLRIERSANVEVDFELEPAHVIRLPGISVAVERRPRYLVQSGFYERKVRGIGSYVERDRIQQLGAAGDLCMVFNELRGFSAWSPDGRCRVRSNRGMSMPRTGLRPQSAGPGASAFNPSWQSVTSRGCTPMFYVDGVPWDAGSVSSLPPIHVEAVEGYAGPATTPPQFTRGLDNYCGTIVIWLRW
jgi:hypothetical protein